MLDSVLRFVESLNPFAVIALCALLVNTISTFWAICKDKFYRRRYRPALEATVWIFPNTPLSVRNIVRTRDRINEPVTADSYSFRILVRNRGNARAEWVEVQAGRLERREANGQFHEVTDFVPLSLRWADEEHTQLPGLSPEMSSYCVLGHVVNPRCRDKFGHSLPEVDANAPILALNTPIPPQSGSHLLAPGVYRLELVLAAANAKPHTLPLHIEVHGWHDDPKTMFGPKGIVITRLDEIIA